jgi:hypothetical protein
MDPASGSVAVKEPITVPAAVFSAIVNEYLPDHRTIETCIQYFIDLKWSRTGRRESKRKQDVQGGGIATYDARVGTGLSLTLRRTTVTVNDVTPPSPSLAVHDSTNCLPGTVSKSKAAALLTSMYL